MAEFNQVSLVLFYILIFAVVYVNILIVNILIYVI